MLYYNYIGKSRNYGVGPDLTMTEAHMLNSIVQTPGTNVTELAQRWERTPGAVCQTLSKLDKKELIERRKAPDNNKNVLLYPSPLGLTVNQAHMMYDISDITSTTQELLGKCSVEEIDAFYKVLGAYLDIIRKEQNTDA